MKNHFIMPYAGNKREEVETIYNNLDLQLKFKKKSYV